MPPTIYFSKEHTWIRIENTTGTVGITPFAQSELGEIVYADLPNIGNTYEQNEVFGTIEALKTVSDLYMPMAGKIIDTNTLVVTEPTLINNHPLADGWLVKIQITNPEQVHTLLTEQQYETLTN
jgi:glycine cleavage system H protein